MGFIYLTRATETSWEMGDLVGITCGSRQVNIEYILYLCSLHNIYFEDRAAGGDLYGWYLWHKR